MLAFGTWERLCNNRWKRNRMCGLWRSEQVHDLYITYERLKLFRHTEQCWWLNAHEKNRCLWHTHTLYIPFGIWTSCGCNWHLWPALPLYKIVNNGIAISGRCINIDAAMVNISLNILCMFEIRWDGANWKRHHKDPMQFAIPNWKIN